MDLSGETIDKIVDKSGLSKKELLNRINEKSNEFSGLITKEGAAYIVSKELGIEMEKANNLMKLKDIMPDLKKVNVAGRIIKITPVREFVKSNGAKGRVVNIYLSDGTGYAKLPLWDEQVNLIQDGMIGLNSTIQVSNAMPKENPFGELELSVGKFGSLSLADDNSEFPSAEKLSDIYFPLSSRRTMLKDITPNTAEIAGNIVQVFRSNFVFANAENENYLVISCMVDDGTGDIQVVFFRELAEQISKLTPEVLSNLDVNSRYNLLEKNLIGKEIIVQGRVVKNKNFDRFCKATFDELLHRLFICRICQ